jgi:hypothetical protein
LSSTDKEINFITGNIYLFAVRLYITSTHITLFKFTEPGHISDADFSPAKKKSEKIIIL